MKYICNACMVPCILKIKGLKIKLKLKPKSCPLEKRKLDASNWKLLKNEKIN